MSQVRDNIVFYWKKMSENSTVELWSPLALTFTRDLELYLDLDPEFSYHLPYVGRSGEYVFRVYRFPLSVDQQRGSDM